MPEAIDQDEFHRKLKLTLKHLIGEYKKLMDLIATIKDDDTKSKHSSSAIAKVTSIKLPKLSIPKFSGDVLDSRTFWEQFLVLIHNRDQLSDAEKLAYLKDRHLKGWSCRARYLRASTDGRHLQ